MSAPMRYVLVFDLQLLQRLVNFPVRTKKGLSIPSNERPHLNKIG